MRKKTFAVILAGCGHQDGAEIHEATLTLWAIHKHGCEFQCYAPDIKQHHVLNHINGQEMNEQRNVLIESARIARGKIAALATFSPDSVDALILPGGFGAAATTPTTCAGKLAWRRASWSLCASRSTRAAPFCTQTSSFTTAALTRRAAS